MRPRAWDPLTNAEIDGRIREFQYSTVMDYGENFVVTDARGLGHYDRAAIKMGYGDLVEVFSGRGASEVGVSWVSFIRDNGWLVPVTPSSFFGLGLEAYEYTDWPSFVGGLSGLEGRDEVPYESLVDSPGLAELGVEARLADAHGRPMVPYLFCSDEQADLNPECFRYDSGADAYESLQSVIDSYWNYYVFNAFRRGRVDFDPGGYTDRVISRYFEKLQRANQSYVLWRGIFEDVFAGDPSLDDFVTRSDGLGAWTLGVDAGYEILTRVITTPEPGSYVLEARDNGALAWLPGATAATADVVLDPVDGRALETTWDFDQGYYWFNQVERAGYFYDKVAAILILTDPNTSFLGRDTTADIRRFQINFQSSFGPSLSSFLRGLLGQAWATIAPRVGDDGVPLAWPDAAELVERDMGGDPVDPATSFSIQLYAAVYAMALLPDTFDQSFANRARIFVAGGAEGVDLVGPTIEFTDPASGLTYIAGSYVDDDGLETGVAAQMLLHAQELADRGETVALARFVDHLDVLRRLTWIYGFGG